MGFVDLHTHSCCSDGTLTPGGLVDYAIEKGLDALALTDHDTVETGRGDPGDRVFDGVQ